MVYKDHNEQDIQALGSIENYGSTGHPKPKMLVYADHQPKVFLRVPLRSLIPIQSNRLSSRTVKYCMH